MFIMLSIILGQLLHMSNELKHGESIAFDGAYLLIIVLIIGRLIYLKNFNKEN